MNFEKISVTVRECGNEKRSAMFITYVDEAVIMVIDFEKNQKLNSIPE